MIKIFSIYNFFDQYCNMVYFVQQYLYRFLFISISSQNITFSFILFCLGILTIFTPCFVSTLPLALSYINLNQGNKLSKNLFILGLMTSLVLLIILTHFISFYSYLYQLPIFSYLVLILVSLDLIKVVNFSKFYSVFRKISFFTYQRNNIFQNYFIGLTIGFSSLPCNTSIVIFTNLLLKNVDNILILLFYLLIYLLGSILPIFLILNIQINYHNFYSFSLFWNAIFPLSGSFLFIFSYFSLLKIIFL
uniref:Thiol:disulfide interchange protein n=1 Tax=Thaumatella adunca TaxID=2006976 RepID=A0A1Z1MN67_9FLOR|nr:thiol:disulfide interchange protein [Thaumatella adunca]ARW67366.1 thiol:disulfide interchange protein [Thaumatella adunca]